MTWGQVGDSRHKVFELGEVVSPLVGRSPLKPGRYVVEAYVAPQHPGDPAILFVVGFADPMDAHNFVPASPESED